MDSTTSSLKWVKRHERTRATLRAVDDGRSGRDGQDGWEPPIPVGQLLRESPVFCAFQLGVMLVFSLLGFRILATKQELPPITYVPLGIVGGVTAWWLLMTGFAKGWIDDDA